MEGAEDKLRLRHRHRGRDGRIARTLRHAMRGEGETKALAQGWHLQSMDGVARRRAGGWDKGQEGRLRLMAGASEGLGVREKV